MSQHLAEYLKELLNTPDEHTWELYGPEPDPCQHGDESVMFCVEEENIVQDRVVVTSIGSEEDAAACHSDELSSEPRELFLHRKIAANALDSGISDLRTYSYRHSERHAPHKLYKKYAPRGTLSQLILLYEDKRKVISDGANSPPIAYAPEPFVWYLFNKLVDACHTIRTADDANQYIHVDLRPSNIHISECRNPNDRPFYKHAVIGDLSCTKILGFDYYTDVFGSPGFQAPEQVGPTFPHTPVKTDVFLIGITIWCLMYRCSTGIPLKPQSIEEFLDTAKYEYDYDELYSFRLEVLMKRCLRSDVGERIGFGELRREVAQGLEECDGTHDVHRYRKRAADAGGDRGWVEEGKVHKWRRVRFRDDDVPVGEPYRKKRRMGNVSGVIVNAADELDDYEDL